MDEGLDDAGDDDQIGVEEQGAFIGGIYAYINESLELIARSGDPRPGGGIGTNGVYVLITEPPAVPGQSDWSVIVMALILLAAASAIIARRLLSPARRAL